MKFSDANQPLFVISVAAELAEMHPQTLRQYDRLGLVTPSRLPGRARRYSPRDVERLQEIQKLSQEGVSLEGIKRILQLENQMEALHQKVLDLSTQLQQAQDQAEESRRVFAAGLRGDVVRLRHGERPRARQRTQALMLYSAERAAQRLAGSPRAEGRPEQGD